MSCSYDNELRASLEAAPIASSVSEAKAWRGEVRLQYKSQEEFEQLAVAFGMMKERRDGVPRAAYHGVVRCSSLSSVPRAIHPSMSPITGCWCSPQSACLYAHVIFQHCQGSA